MRRGFSFGFGFGFNSFEERDTGTVNPPAGPDQVVFSSLDVMENAPVGTVVGNLFTYGGQAPYSYALSSDVGNKLSVDGDQLKVAGSLDGLDHYDFGVTVTDDNALTATTDSSLNVLAVPVDDNGNPNSGGTDPGAGTGSGSGSGGTTVDDGPIIIPDQPPDPDPNLGFELPPVQQDTNDGLHVTGKNAGYATFFKDWGKPIAGNTYIFRYRADWSLMSKQGREAAVGIAFKNGDNFHLVALRGNGGNPATMRRSKIYGSFSQANRFTITDDGAAKHGTKDGPNWIQIFIADNGASYTFSTSADGVIWEAEYTASLSPPVSPTSSALQFGVGGYFTNTDKGIFKLMIDEFFTADTLTLALDELTLNGSTLRLYEAA